MYIIIIIINILLLINSVSRQPVENEQRRGKITGTPVEQTGLGRGASAWYARIGYRVLVAW